MSNQPFEQNGIIITPEIFQYGDMIRVTYNGVLVNQGADKIWVLNTFNKEWKSSKETEMKKNQQNVFEINIPLDKAGTLDLAFKDSADNWDSNFGNNYIIEVH